MTHNGGSYSRDQIEIRAFVLVSRQGAGHEDTLLVGSRDTPKVFRSSSPAACHYRRV